MLVMGDSVKKTGDKMPEKQALEQLMTIMSMAAHQGNERALKVVDEIQTIMTTDWDQLPLKLREDMAYVMAQMLVQPVEQAQEIEE